jgi:hypothetical protein
MKSFVQLFIFLLCVSLSGLVQAQSLDGPNHIFEDEFISNLAGSWRMSGTILGRAVNHTVEAQWVLNHQFLQIHENSLDAPTKGEPAYEAIVMIGYDNASERYVAHWNDIYGGRFSETLGYGTKSGNQIEFVFEYPDGPFHTTFRWLPDKKQWQWLMRTKDSSGKWADFANVTLVRQ